MLWKHLLTGRNSLGKRCWDGGIRCSSGCSWWPCFTFPSARITGLFHHIHERQRSSAESFKVLPPSTSVPVAVGIILRLGYNLDVSDDDDIALNPKNWHLGRVVLCWICITLSHPVNLWGSMELGGKVMVCTAQLLCHLVSRYLVLGGEYPKCGWHRTWLPLQTQPCPAQHFSKYRS